MSRIIGKRDARLYLDDRLLSDSQLERRNIIAANFSACVGKLNARDYTPLHIFANVTKNVPLIAEFRQIIKKLYDKMDQHTRREIGSLVWPSHEHIYGHGHCTANI